MDIVASTALTMVDSDAWVMCCVSATIKRNTWGKASMGKGGGGV